MDADRTRVIPMHADALIPIRTRSDRTWQDTMPCERMLPYHIGARVAKIGVLLITAMIAYGVADELAAGSRRVNIWSHPQSHVFVYTLDDKEVLIWHVDKSQLVSHFLLPQIVLQDFPKERGGVSVVSIIPTRNDGLIAILTDKKRVLFNSSTKSVVSTHASPTFTPLYYYEGDKTLVVVDETDAEGRTWAVAVDVISGERVHRWPYIARNELCRSFDTPAYAERFHHKGFMGVAGARGGASCWDLRAGKEIWKVTLKYPGGIFRFSADAKEVLLRHHMPEVREASSGRILSRLEMAANETMSDGEFGPRDKVVLLEVFPNKILLWDWKNNAVRHTYTVPGGNDDSRSQTFCAQFSSKGDRIVTPSANMKVYEFDTGTGALVAAKIVLDNHHDDEFDVTFPDWGVGAGSQTDVSPKATVR